MEDRRSNAYMQTPFKKKPCGEFDALICHMILHTCLTGVNTVQKFIRLYFSYALFYISPFLHRKIQNNNGGHKKPNNSVLSKMCDPPITM